MFGDGTFDYSGPFVGPPEEIRMQYAAELKAMAEDAHKKRDLRANFVLSALLFFLEDTEVLKKRVAKLEAQLAQQQK